jgi:hypothetical protein
VTDWIEHDGGPQPVADDVWVEFWSPAEGLWRIHTNPAGAVDWASRGFQWRILNQHLIDAARLESIRLGLEAAAREAEIGDICLLDPATIAKEADQ